MDFTWLFLDLETTGLDSQVDHILEVAALTVKPGGQREAWQTLVNPGVPIPSKITLLTGIDETMLAVAPDSKQLEKELPEILAGKIIVAHNAPFDLGFLEALLGKLPNQWIDTLQLAKIVYPHLPSYSLGYLIKRFSLSATPAHRAYADTLAVEKLFFHLLNELQKLPLATLQNIYSLLGDESQGLTSLWGEILRAKLKVGFSEPLKIEPSFSSEEISDFFPWDLKELLHLFSPQGSIAQGFNFYEERPQQLEMLKAVARAFEKQRFLVVEAGTGVGKSLAYLVPALAWAVSQDEKVVVATHTIALQEQLWQSEIKFLKKQLPFHFRAAVLKGRNNYFCLREWHLLRERAVNLNWSGKIFLARLEHWLANEKTGDRDTITLRGEERELFSQLASSKENCLGMKCPFKEECFYQRAREKASQADLIIVNHSLLFSDIKTQEALLPKYNYLIIDEAHHLEDEGAKQFTETFSLREVLKKVAHWEKKNFLHLPPRFFSKAEPLIKDLKKGAQLIQKKGEEILASSPLITKWSQRIDHFTLKKKWWRDLKICYRQLFFELEALLVLLAQLVDLLEAEEKLRETKQLLKIYNAELKNLLALGKRFFDRKDDQAIYWLEVGYRPSDLLLQITPLNIAVLFQEFLFSKLKSVVLTSATLSVAGKFDFLIERIGLPPKLVDTLQITSPFNYEQQSLLLIDQSLPDPARASGDEFNIALQKALQEILEATTGRTLVLFTAHRQLQAMYYALKAPLKEKGLELYADRIDGRRYVLLEELKNNEKAIVFGSNTFWEGIDLPGSLLTAVIMVRLPFWPPNNPLIEARVEAVEKEGKSGFFNYSLPRAVLRFRQGYGRLIRTKDDWGTVIILDNRLLKKRYGRVFLRSLPQKRYLAGDTQEIKVAVEQWFSEKNKHV